MADIDQKQYIERAIDRARDGVGSHIDELDRRLRTQLDPKSLATRYTPQLMIGGAVLGVIVGFGLPKILRRAITWGVPLAIAAMTIRNARKSEESPGFDQEPDALDYEY